MPPEWARLREQGISLRPVTPFDEPFLRALYRSVRDPELALTAWDAAAKDAFANQQFDLQDHWYREHYAGAQLLVIERDGISVGRIYLFEAGAELRVMDIALIPAARNAGLGTSLMGEVMRHAAERRAAVTLHVEVFNPARALYDRLGFREQKVEGVYAAMRWEPPVTAG